MTMPRFLLVMFQSLELLVPSTIVAGPDEIHSVQLFHPIRWQFVVLVFLSLGMTPGPQGLPFGIFGNIDVTMLLFEILQLLILCLKVLIVIFDSRFHLLGPFKSNFL